MDLHTFIGQYQRVIINVVHTVSNEKTIGELSPDER